MTLSRALLRLPDLVRRRLPRRTDSALGKVRLATLAFGLVTAVALGGQINPALGLSRVLLGLLGFGGLVAVFLATYLRRRLFLGEPLLSGAVIVLSGTSLKDPLATIGLLFAVFLTQPLYGSRRAAIVRMAAGWVALPLTIYINPISLGRHIDWRGASATTMLPVFVMVGTMMRSLYGTIVAHQEAADREYVLIQAGSRMLKANSLEEIRVISTESARQMTALSPGVFGVAISPGDGYAIVRACSESSGLSPGLQLPLELITAPDRPTGAVRPGSAYLAEVEKLVGRRHWRVGEITMPDGPWLMLVGSNRRVPSDLMDSYEMLAVQRSFAEMRIQSHADLDHQVHHDALTSLPNRTQFFSRLAAAVDAGGAVALIVIDLDDFKIVNDTYGHPAGDELLIAVAGRLREAAGVRGVPARFGGDEFAILLPGADEAEALAVAERVRDVLHEPIALTSTTVCSRASVGLARGEPRMTATDLMRCADIAMYWAKARGKGRVEQYTREAHGDVVAARMLEEHLPYAVSREELVVYYQPHVDLASQECVGAEALVRWQHPTMGLIPPAEFIPMAERTGQIGVVGGYVLRVACRQMAEWNRSTGQSLRLAVNVAARQLLDGGFTETVRRTLVESGLPAELLTLELTESEIIDDQTSVRQLRELADLGVRISIDDFGTGYTSLASLRSFPVHQIKIDRTFIETRDTARAEAMLQLIISVGQVLDLETVAEGVETDDQRDALVKAGVPLAQGYLFGRPMPAEDFAAWCGTVRSSDRPTTSGRTTART